MALKTEYVIAGIIIALLVGVGAGYFYGQYPIAGYKEEIQNLETENTSLEDQKEQLQADLASIQSQIESLTANLTVTRSSMEGLKIELLETRTEIETVQLSYSELEVEYILLQNVYQDIEDEYYKLQSDNDELQESYDVLQAAFEGLNQSYSDLLNCLDSTIIDSYVQSIEYNISAGTDRTWEFLIPKYGIIWEARISFSGEYVSMSHAWRRGEERFFVGSSGRSLIYKDSEYLVYYGRQEYLWGNITVEYYLDPHDSNKIWVAGTILSNLPTIGSGGSAYIDIYDIPEIDGFAEIGEWPPFEDMPLVYDVTYNNSIRSEESAWDTENKAMEISAMINNSNLYVCAVIPDDYLSEDYQIDALYLYLNGELGTTIRWTTADTYRVNLWATYGAVSQYSHTGGGEPGADGIYTIEIHYPLGDLKVDELSIQFAEVTKYNVQGFFETSSYWVGATIYDIFVLGN